jgi:hypothetical protein
MVRPITWRLVYSTVGFNFVFEVLPPFQILSHPTFSSQSISSLTKIIEKITKIYDIKLYYKNIIIKESNDTYLIYIIKVIISLYKFSQI